MRPIVAFIDFSDTTGKILEEACAKAKEIDAEVVLVHVVPPPLVRTELIAGRDPSEDYLAQAEELLGLRDSVSALGVRATAKQVQGPVLETILDQIKKLQPVLAIIAAARHGPVRELYVDDMTTRIIEQVTCGVLVVASEGPPPVGAQGIPSA